MILDLPEDRHLVIDSKVSLNAYTDYCNTEGEEARKQALRQHLQSVRAHLKELSAREYQDLYGLKSLDFVLMFVPVEPAFMVAIANDSRLWQDAYDKNVLLVSPEQPVMRGADRGPDLAAGAAEPQRGGDRQTRPDSLRQVCGLCRRSAEDRRASWATRARPTRAPYNKLARADGNLVSQAQKLVKLGVKPNKALPQPLLDQATQADEMLELAAVSEERGEED